MSVRETQSYFIKAIDRTFYGFTDVVTHAGCERKSTTSRMPVIYKLFECSLNVPRGYHKSQINQPQITSRGRVIYKLFECSLNIPRGYHAGKPIESVVYCFFKK